MTMALGSYNDKIEIPTSDWAKNWSCLFALSTAIKRNQIGTC